MEPLSITVSVIALVDFGQRLISFVNDVIKNALGYPKEFGDLAGELRGLCCLLTAIKNEEEFMKYNSGNSPERTDRWSQTYKGGS
jgi:hypothetical protein